MTMTSLGGEFKGLGRSAFKAPSFSFLVLPPFGRWGSGFKKRPWGLRDWKRELFHKRALIGGLGKKAL